MFSRTHASGWPALGRGLFGAFLLVIAVVPTGPAAAQGLLQQLFGFGAPPAIAHVPVPVSPRPKPQSEASTVGGPRNREPKAASAGTYRTVCVRMCDGFYIPMSFATTRENFMQDQMKCRSTCGGEARLFVHRNPGGAMDDAVDLSGRPYSAMPTAFKFRKALVQGCSCRPPPWSETELARHQSYAAAPTVGSAGSTSTRVAAAPAQANPGTGRPEPPDQVVMVAPPSSNRANDRAEAVTKPRTLDKSGLAIEQTSNRTASRAALKPTRVAARAQPAPVYIVPPKPAAGFLGLGMGQYKYKWPGD